MNLVGYYDAQFVAGSNLVANPFDSGNNTISNLFAGLPAGSVYLPWNPVVGGFGPTNQFAGAAGWTDGAAVLDRRGAGFLWLPSAATVTFVGEAWPTTCIFFPPGFTASGVLPRHSCGFCVSCAIVLPDAAQVIPWDRVRQRWVTFDYSLDFGWFPSEPEILPDEAALVYNPGPVITAGSTGVPAPGQVPLLNPRIEGTNFVVEFPSYNGVEYAVQCSATPCTGGWRTILSKTATSSGAYTRVVVPMDGASRFFRLHALRLVNPARAGTQFTFDFYAEQGTRYRVSRSASLEHPAWQLVTEIDGTGDVVTASDFSAVARSVYYRVEY